MDPQGNKNSYYPYPNHQRYPYDRYPGAYGGMGSMQGGLPYMVPSVPSLQQFYYPNHPYMGSQYSANGYHSAMPNSWRNLPYGPGGMRMTQMMPRNYYTQENSCVNSREIRQREVPEIINLDSEEQMFVQPLPPPRNVKGFRKQLEKADVIQIQDDSAKILQEIQVIPLEPVRSSNLQKNSNKQRVEHIQQDEREQKKPVIEDIRTKPIRKVKKSQNKDYSLMNKPYKQKKSSEVIKNKQPQQTKKKVQKVVKKTPQPVETKKKNQLIEKTPTNETKKQIAKYMESHGQIRHGKQFQSIIPEIKQYNGLDFHSWVLAKRNKMLIREIGALTV